MRELDENYRFREDALLELILALGLVTSDGRTLLLSRPTTDVTRFLNATL